MLTQNDIPGGVSLCQVSGEVSCGACCGLYNIPGLSRERLTAVLRERSSRLASLPRRIDALDAFAAEEQERLGDPRPYPELHHCPFVGLIGGKRTRVGCLLHPLVPENRGLDFRGLSYYGGAACRYYFCPSHFRLPASFKRILQLAAPDWYCYGLMLTEHRLIEAFFREIESRLGRSLQVSEFQEASGPREALRDVLELKESWPHRRSGARGACHFVFEDEDPLRDDRREGRPEQGPDRLEVMLRELGSGPLGHEERMRAEASLETLLDGLVQAVRAV